ncbi:MAG TPA: DMT family transporter, partial [Stellaceae bacterium]|nr:DMT family transporter [Stellaceae bacterium]
AATARQPAAVAYVLLAALSLFWGLNWPVMKVVLGEIAVLPFRALCLSIAGPLLLAIAALRGDPLALKRHEIVPLLVAALLNVTLWQLFSAYGVSLMAAGRASIIAYTMPAWAMLFGALILGEPFGVRGLVALVLGMGGVGALLLPDLARIAIAPMGAVAMLAAAISWASGTVVMKRFRWSCSVTALTGWQTTLGGLPIIAAAIVIGPFPGLEHVDAAGLSALAYVILMGMVFSQWAWFAVLGRLPVAVASIGSLAVPMVGVLSSALLLHEPVGPAEFAALALVVAAFATVLLHPAPPRH